MERSDIRVTNSKRTHNRLKRYRPAMTSSNHTKPMCKTIRPSKNKLDNSALWYFINTEERRAVLLNIANKPFRPAIPCSPATLHAPSSLYAASTKAQFGNSRHFQCSTYAKTTHSLPLTLVSFQKVLFFSVSLFFFPPSLTTAGAT